MRSKAIPVALAFLLALGSGPVLALSSTGESAQQPGGGDPINDRATEPVTFYGSMFGHGLFEPMPLNTVFPIGQDSYGVGYLANCGPGPAMETPLAGGYADCESANWNKMAFFSSPGPVDVENREEFLQEGGYSLVHNERGQLTDIHLDPNENIQAGVYFVYSMHAWPIAWANEEGTNCMYPHPESLPCVWPSWRWHPGVFEDVVMEATLYAMDLGEMHMEASEPPPIEERLAGGEHRKIAHGQWGPETVITGFPGFPMAIHAEIDLGAPESDVIEQDEDFVIVFSSQHDTAGVEYNAGSPLRWYGGEFFPPTIEMPVKNAITVERVLPTFVHGQLAIVSVVAMPWGNYDVTEQGITFDIQGPDGQTVDAAPEHVRSLDIEQSLAHGGHYQPVNKTLIWDYANDGADPGTYDVTVTATNLQGSASHVCTASFTLEESDEGELEPGTVDVGLCGEQTLADDDLEDVLDDVEEETDDG